MNPDRISLFNYAHLPHLFKAQRQIDIEQMPTPATKLAVFRNTLARLLDAGYEFIGMDHFARPEDSLVKAKRNGTMVRNFQGYSTHGGLDLISFGPSAISQVGDSFAQNHRKLEDWVVSLIEGRLPTARGLTRNTDDRLRGDIIERIMCNGQLVYRDIERDYQLVFRRYFAEEIERLAPLADDGLIEFDDGGFAVTANGLLFLRAIAKVFDAYLAPAGQSRGRFSRIV
jgi:oxygen-independent coproporphyrinogen-3 oxidase